MFATFLCPVAVVGILNPELQDGEDCSLTIGDMGECDPELESKD
jgi:hypothetical protein